MNNMNNVANLHFDLRNPHTCAVWGALSAIHQAAAEEICHEVIAADPEAKERMCWNLSLITCT